jgi:hypothetical protein
LELVNLKKTQIGEKNVKSSDMSELAVIILKIISDIRQKAW